mmetsp:Transcript_27180/g.56951  ORF Transcript_27180/g.56951 Transcript_27180/m.56951 type:complete len:294 (-) Transcript_27180:247-1128(-)
MDSFFRQSQNRRSLLARGFAAHVGTFLLTRFNDTRSNQLFNLGANRGILHGLLGGIGVFAKVFENLLHDGILQDTLNFWIGHGVGGLFLLFRFRHVGSTVIDLHLHLLQTFLARLVIGIQFQTLFVGFHGLVIFLHVHFDISLAGPSLDVFGIQFQSYFNTALRTAKVHNFTESRCQVVANGGIFGSTLDRFLVGFHSRSPFLVAKVLISTLFSLFGLFITLIGECVRLFLFEFHRFEESLGILVVVFQLCFLAHFNGIFQVLLLLVGLGGASVGLTSVFKGSAVLLSYFDRL